MIELQELGIIELSGNTVISDPCHDRDTWCSIQGFTVKPGLYKAVSLNSCKNYFPRIAGIVCYHNESFADVHEVARRRWVEVGVFYVDSGQAGIFDDSIYPQSKDDNGDYDDPSSFYGECCDITLNPLCGCLHSNKGVVTSSGYGDGCYSLYAVYKKNERVALIMDFGVLKLRQALRDLDSKNEEVAMQDAKAAIFHCIEQMDFENPDQLIETESGSFILTTTGRSRLFTPYRTAEYFAKWRVDKDFRLKHLHRAMTYYITEEDYVE